MKQSRTKQTFTLGCVNPGIVIQRAVIYGEGLMKSYVGPSAAGTIILSIQLPRNGRME